MRPARATWTNCGPPWPPAATPTPPITTAALHLAAAEGHLGAVRFLLDTGARPAATDRWGGTPLTDARRAKHTAVADLLRSHDPAEEPAAGVLTDLSLPTAGTHPNPEDNHAIQS